MSAFCCRYLEVSVSLAAVKETSVDAEVAAFFFKARWYRHWHGSLLSLEEMF